MQGEGRGVTSYESEINMASSSSGKVLPYQFEPLKPQETQRGDPREDTDDSDEDLTRKEGTKWCLCGNCAVMDILYECRCCRESIKMLNKMSVHSARLNRNFNCITDVPAFRRLCLDIDVLEVAYYHYKQDFGQDDKTQQERYRYIAYRQFTRWIHTTLGYQIREPLPACALLIIRNAFSSPVYKGFALPKLN